MAVFCGGLLCTGANAQVAYSTDSNYFKNKTEQNNLLSVFRSNYPDSSITELQNYFPRNFMGNIGLPSPNYLFNYGTENLGFILFQPPTRNDVFKEKDITYYRSKGPYADLTGVAGSKQLQIFKLLFTHTYKRVNLTLKLNRYTSTGFYKHQQTYTNNVFFTSNYSTKNNRWGYYVYALNNGNKNSENGGIYDTLLNASTQALRKELVRTRITTASRSNGETKFMFNPWFKLNKHSDTLKGIDHFIQVKSNANFNTFRYRDNNVSTNRVYPIKNVDTLKTNDSSRVTQFVNEVNYAVMSINKTFALSAGYKHEYTKLRQYVWKDTLNTLLYQNFFTNHILSADAVYRTDSKPDSLNTTPTLFESKVNAQYIVSGFYAGNAKAESNSFFVFNAKKHNKIFLDVLFEKRNPDFIYNNWFSNHFVWQNNNYSPQTQLQAKFGISLYKLFTLSAFYQAVSNYLYFDHAATPQQHSGAISNTGLSADVTKLFFKHLGVGLTYLYQTTSQKNIVRIPQHTLSAKLFLNGNLFKGNMNVQLGVQVQQYSSFYAYSYMPATEIFYLQNQIKTSEYPYLDVYLNVRIRPVSVFLKMENALQGFVGNDYFLVPGYYQTDRAFRFGLKWVFFD
ncbi:MAG: hypothetical protein KF900_01825 [Bacteroidetes bacterium]|nr:hypothetical protein [Bacteroidota bacterium]